MAGQPDVIVAIELDDPAKRDNGNKSCLDDAIWLLAVVGSREIS
jgi:hypothetical protein